MKTIATLLVAAGLLAAAHAMADHEGHALDDQAVSRGRDANPCPDRQSQFDMVIANLGVQMEAIRGTDDPEERRRLMRNHMQTLREAMDLVGDREDGGAREAPRKAQDKDKGMMGKGGMMHGPAMHRNLEQR